jgi:hypothetical protein
MENAGVPFGFAQAGFFASQQTIRLSVALVEMTLFLANFKEGNSKGRDNRRSFDCAVRKRRELLRSG